MPIFSKKGFHINSSKAIGNLKKSEYKYSSNDDGSFEVCDPNGYKFVLNPSDEGNLYNYCS